MKKFKVTLILVALVLMSACGLSNKKMDPGVYKSDVLEVEIEHDRAMGVHFKHLPDTLAASGGSVDYEHIQKEIFKINFGSDTPGLDKEYYAIQHDDYLELIDTRSSVEDIEKGEYTAQFKLKKAQ